MVNRKDLRSDRDIYSNRSPKGREILEELKNRAISKPHRKTGKRPVGRPKGAKNTKTLLTEAEKTLSRHKSTIKRQETILKNKQEQELYVQFYNNPLMWAMFYFRHHFRMPSPPFHLKIILDATKNSHLAIAAPRGSAKSTLLNFVYPFHALCFKRKRFIVMLSNTYSQAAMHLKTMKTELKDNDRLKGFGIKVIKDAEGDSEFQHPDGFVTKIICRGVDQMGSVRGSKFGAYRPDLIVGDDMEDDELVRSTERRVKLKEDFDTALIPAGDLETCQYIFIGTILHDDSQLSKLLDKDQYTHYKKLFYKAYDDVKRTSLWPEKWTIEELEHMQETSPLMFAKEMQNDPVSGKNVRFTPTDFRYWRMNDNLYELLDPDGSIIKRGYLNECRGAISCDLAWSQKREADYSAIIGGYITPENDILVEAYFNERGLRPDRFTEIIYSLRDRLQGKTKRSVPLGLEKAMLENVQKYLLKLEMRKRNDPITLKELKWDADKITRIETRLQPRYNNHMIFHRQNMGELETQLSRFPYSAHDDLVDSLQGLIQLLKQAPQRKKKGVPIEDPLFEWLRNKSINNNRTRKSFSFGKKQKSFEIPSETTFR